MIELIFSGGGPLVLLQDDLLPLWGGVENVGGLRSGERGCFGTDRLCDYDRACAVGNWAGAVPVGNGVGVVFGGDNLGLGLQRAGRAGLLVVRPWCHEEDLDERVSALLACSPPFEACFEVAVTAGAQTAFDSANPGFEILPPTLRASLEPGHYVVSTCAHRWDGPSGVTLHQLDRRR